MNTPLHAAAIVYDAGDEVDALLAEVVQAQRQAGRRVRGLLMARSVPGPGCAAETVMVDIASGERYLVSQPLGRDSTACRADPQGFARAGGVLRAAAGDAPELVVVNRFGKLEAEGGGLRAELLEILSRDIPLLTSVSRGLADEWQRFTGGASQLLAPTRAAVDGWLASTSSACNSTPG